jgi:glycosyltransferase involved in cell wall biosynthesis
VKVLHVIDSLEPAGAEQSLVAMVPALHSLGIDGVVAHFGAGTGLGPVLEGAGFGVHRVAGRGLREQLRGLGEVIDRVRPDLVHTSLFTADVVGRVAARRARLPVVSSLVTMQYSRDRRAAEMLPAWKINSARALDAGTAQLVTRFHAITEAAAEHARDRLHVRRIPIEVIPRGRSGDALGRRTQERRERVRRSLGWEDDQEVVIAVARQEPAKALDVLLDAAGRLGSERQRMRVVLIGRDGSASAQLANRTRDLDMSQLVDQLGPRDDVADLMVGADLLVLPSRREGLGGVLLEALALELPIVASDLPPIAEVAPHDEVALLTPPGDAVALARAIAATLDDAAGSQRRAASGRARFEQRYTIESVAEQMAALYGRALGASGEGGQR